MVKYIRLLSPDQNTSYWENYFNDPIVIKPYSKIYLSSVALDLTAVRLTVDATNNTFRYKLIAGAGNYVTVQLTPGVYSPGGLCDEITKQANSTFNITDARAIGRQFTFYPQDGKLRMVIAGVSQAKNLDKNNTTIANMNNGNPSFTYTAQGSIFTSQLTGNTNPYSAWVLSSTDISSCSQNSITLPDANPANSIYGMVDYGAYTQTMADVTIGTAQMKYCILVNNANNHYEYKNDQGVMTEFVDGNNAAITPAQNDKLFININLGNIEYIISRNNAELAKVTIPYDFKPYSMCVSANAQNVTVSFFSVWLNATNTLLEDYTLSEQADIKANQSVVLVDCRVGDFAKLTGFDKVEYRFQNSLLPPPITAAKDPNAEGSPASFYINLPNFSGLLDSYDSNNTANANNQIYPGKQPILCFVPYLVNYSANNIVYTPPYPVKISLNNVNEVLLNNIRVELFNEKGVYLQSEDKASVVIVIEDPEE